MGLQNPYPADLGGVVSVRSAASLDIDAFNVDYTERISWDNTALIKAESMYFFGVGLVHESFFYVDAVVDQAVSRVLNLLFLLGRNALVVGDVEMSLFSCLLGTGLPNVWSKDFFA